MECLFLCWQTLALVLEGYNTAHVEGLPLQDPTGMMRECIPWMFLYNADGKERQMLQGMLQVGPTDHCTMNPTIQNILY